MSEEELELLITTDDPGEDTLEEDTFHLQADDSTARTTVRKPLAQGIHSGK